MINLLPNSYADAIRYGRQNSKLRDWLIGMAAATGGLILILAGGWLYIGQQQKTFQKNIDHTNQQLKALDLTGVQKNAKEITGDIKVITKILGSEIRFSDLIQAIGADMPPATALKTLSLNNQVSGAVDLTAVTNDHASAAQVAVNLTEAQNDLFSKIDILDITCNRSSTATAYPCKANYRALFSKTAQTKYLGVAGN